MPPGLKKLKAVVLCDWWVKVFRAVYTIAGMGPVDEPHEDLYAFQPSPSRASSLNLARDGEGERCSSRVDPRLGPAVGAPVGNCSSSPRYQISTYII